MSGTKPFTIEKRDVWEAFQHVDAKGCSWCRWAALESFGERFGPNLYKLWNRMSSGSYMPSPVRRVMIPKADGGQRPLGIPTVTDRIAQGVVRQYLEPLVEPVFHRDSYGYRPERSAIDAIRTARRRCWRFDWVLDMDIKGFFDTIDYELLLKAVRHHTDCRWVLLYIERWLKAPVMMEGGSLVSQERGTPQGGVISPLLANLFLHYAFDKWMDRENPQVPFERYADDIICHCRTEGEARRLWRQVEDRLAECGLSLHPQKTKIVYCKDTNRKGSFPTVAFDFLGYRFQPRLAIWRGGLFGVSYLPAAAPKALKAFRRRVRNWGLQRRSDKGLTDLARMFNRQIEGWIGYFRCFYKSALYPTLRLIDAHLVRWVMRKYKRFKQRPRQARLWLARIVKSTPGLFAHWSLLYANG